MGANGQTDDNDWGLGARALYAIIMFGSLALLSFAILTDDGVAIEAVSALSDQAQLSN